MDISPSIKSCSARFRELLQSVAEEHVREVAHLRQSLEALHAKHDALLSNRSFSPPVPIEMEPPPLPMNPEDSAVTSDFTDELVISRLGTEEPQREETSDSGLSASDDEEVDAGVAAKAGDHTKDADKYFPILPSQMEDEKTNSRGSNAPRRDRGSIMVFDEKGNHRRSISIDENGTCDSMPEPRRTSCEDAHSSNSNPLVSGAGIERLATSTSLLGTGTRNSKVSVTFHGNELASVGEEPPGKSQSRISKVSFGVSKEPQRASKVSFTACTLGDDDDSPSAKMLPIEHHNSADSCSSELWQEGLPQKSLSKLIGGDNSLTQGPSGLVRFKFLGMWTDEGFVAHKTQRVDRPSALSASLGRSQGGTGSGSSPPLNKGRSLSKIGWGAFYSRASTTVIHESLFRRCVQRCRHKLPKTVVSHPNSHFNFWMDVVSMALIALDMAVIPLESFDVSQTTFMAIFYVVSSCYWTCDLLRNLVKGYYSKGNVVLKARRVVMHYLRRWFPLEFPILIIDWYCVHAHRGFAGRQLDSSVRVMHALRLLRVLGVGRFMKSIEDTISSESVSVMWTMGKLFVCIVAINHFLACCWYGIGTSTSSLPNWVDLYLDDSATFAYRYFSSYHWALTQFTPASISIQPHNIYERFFNVIVLLFALLTVSTFVSGITAAVMRLNAMQAAKNKQFWLLRKYLKEFDVPPSLTVRVTTYCTFAFEEQTSKVKEENVQLLVMLSTSLRAELRAAIYRPCLEHHPFFVLVGRIAYLALQALCNTGVQIVEIGKGDKLFSGGQTCEQMFFISSGTHNYHLHDTEPPEHVSFGDWLSEAALWTHWSNKGMLQAKNNCQVFAIPAVKFCDAMKTHQDSLEESLQYGQGFLAGLNRVALDKLSDLYKCQKVEGLWFRLLQEQPQEARFSGDGAVVTRVRSSHNAYSKTRSRHLSRLASHSSEYLLSSVGGKLGRLKQSIFGWRRGGHGSGCHDHD